MSTRDHARPWFYSAQKHAERIAAIFRRLCPGGDAEHVATYCLEHTGVRCWTPAVAHFPERWIGLPGVRWPADPRMVYSHGLLCRDCGALLGRGWAWTECPQVRSEGAANVVHGVLHGENKKRSSRWDAERERDTITVSLYGDIAWSKGAYDELQRLIMKQLHDKFVDGVAQDIAGARKFTPR